MHVCTGNYELMSKKGAVLARPKNAGHNFIQQTSSPGRHARLRNPIIRAKYWWANYSTLELPLSKADSCVCVWAPCVSRLLVAPRHAGEPTKSRRPDGDRSLSAAEWTRSGSHVPPLQEAPPAVRDQPQEWRILRDQPRETAHWDAEQKVLWQPATAASALGKNRRAPGHEGATERVRSRRNGCSYDNGRLRKLWPDCLARCMCSTWHPPCV